MVNQWKSECIMVSGNSLPWSAQQLMYNRIQTVYTNCYYRTDIGWSMYVDSDRYGLGLTITMELYLNNIVKIRSFFLSYYPNIGKNGIVPYCSLCWKQIIRLKKMEVLFAGGVYFFKGLSEMLKDFKAKLNTGDLAILYWCMLWGFKFEERDKNLVPW